MIAQSQSGTGKTAAFVLTMLSRVDPSLPHTQVTTTKIISVRVNFVIFLYNFCSLMCLFALKF